MAESLRKNADEEDDDTEKRRRCMGTPLISRGEGDPNVSEYSPCGIPYDHSNQPHGRTSPIPPELMAFFFERTGNQYDAHPVHIVFFKKNG